VVADTPCSAKAFGECDAYDSGTRGKVEDCFTGWIAGFGSVWFRMGGSDCVAGRSSRYFLADFSHAICVQCWLGNGEVDVEVDDVGGLQSVEYV
jgi:hypothetical protein